LVISTGIFTLQVFGEQVKMKVTEFPKEVGVAIFFEKANNIVLLIIA
jgi:hypothetical protein